MRLLRWLFLGRELAAQINEIEHKHYRDLEELAALAAKEKTA